MRESESERERRKEGEKEREKRRQVREKESKSHTPLREPFVSIKLFAFFGLWRRSPTRFSMTGDTPPLVDDRGEPVTPVVPPPTEEEGVEAVPITRSASDMRRRLSLTPDRGEGTLRSLLWPRSFPPCEEILEEEPERERLSGVEAIIMS